MDIHVTISANQNIHRKSARTIGRTRVSTSTRKNAIISARTNVRNRATAITRTNARTRVGFCARTNTRTSAGSLYLLLLLKGNIVIQMLEPGLEPRLEPVLERMLEPGLEPMLKLVLVVFIYDYY